MRAFQPRMAGLSHVVSLVTCACGRRALARQRPRGGRAAAPGGQSKRGHARCCSSIRGPGGPWTAWRPRRRPRGAPTRRRRCARGVRAAGRDALARPRAAAAAQTHVTGSTQYVASLSAALWPFSSTSGSVSDVSPVTSLYLRRGATQGSAIAPRCALEAAAAARRRAARTSTGCGRRRPGSPWAGASRRWTWQAQPLRQPCRPSCCCPQPGAVHRGGAEHPRRAQKRRCALQARHSGL